MGDITNIVISLSEPLLTFILSTIMRSMSVNFTIKYGLLILLAGLFMFPAVAKADWIDPRDPKFQTPYRSLMPFFPKCFPSRGDLVASYPTGVHGIPGDPATYTGSDKVYSLGNNNYLQCYCPEKGVMGIQVNWLSTNNLTEGQNQFLRKLGWYFVPSGSDWGLSEESYLTRRIDQIMCVQPFDFR